MLFPVSFLGGRVGCCSRLVSLVVEWGVVPGLFPWWYSGVLFPVCFLGGTVGCCSRLVALVEWGVVPG